MKKTEKFIDVSTKTTEIGFALIIFILLYMIWTQDFPLDFTDSSYILNIIRGVSSTSGIIMSFTAFCVTFSLSNLKLPIDYETLSFRIGASFVVIIIASLCLGLGYYEVLIDELPPALTLCTTSLYLSLIVLTSYLLFFYRNLYRSTLVR